MGDAQSNAEVWPARGFFYDRQDVERAREAIRNREWARKAYHNLLDRTQRVMGYSDERIVDTVLSMRDEDFAYNTAGCPCCGKAYPTRQDELLRLLSEPGSTRYKSVSCPHCRTILPNEQLPDTGRGFQLNGKSYYPIGMWNFVYGGWLLGGVRDEEGMVTRLTYLYMLTGDKRYAGKAIVILDAFAAIVSDTLGPRDFSPYGSGDVKGRLHMLTSIVHRVKKMLAIDYDWLSPLPVMDAPSKALERLGQRGTVRENIEALLNDYMLEEPGGVPYQLIGGHLSNLQNHEIDGIRAMIAVGHALGLKDYVQWGIQAADALLYNTIGRDSMYYEGSLFYSLSTAERLLETAWMAERASTTEQLAATRAFASRRFYRYAVSNQLDLLCEGHFPSFGDGFPDLRAGDEPDMRALTVAYRGALCFMRFGTEELKRQAEADAARMYPLIRDSLGDRGKDLFMAHPPEEMEKSRQVAFALPSGNQVMGQAGTVILRSPNNTTALLRFGRTNIHTHDDVLALHLYACGAEVTADIGYMYYRTNGHIGWASKAIAHNTVVVNRDRDMHRFQLYKPFPGGELTNIYESDTVSATEVNAPAWFGVEQYQRALAIAAMEGGGAYVMDWFTVGGGQTSDYAFHAFHEPSKLTWSKGQRIEGATAWTLAGLDAVEAGGSRPYYDEPAKSYGERLTTGETFSELLEDETANHWSPTVNNGYGFVFDLQEYAAEEGAFSVGWHSESGKRLHLHGLTDEGDRLFGGRCPSLTGETHHPILIWRSGRERKTFQAVMQTAEPSANVVTVQRIERLWTTERATATAVRLSNGTTDYWFYADEPDTASMYTPFGLWQVEGRWAWLRLDARGERICGDLIDGSAYRFNGSEIAVQSSRRAKVEVVDVDAEKGQVRLADEMVVASGDRVLFRSSRSRTSTCYRVAHADPTQRTVLMEDSFVLSKGIVEALSPDGRLESRYPFPLGSDLVFQGKETLSPFVGKTVIGEKGGSARILKVVSLKVMEVEVLQPFDRHERFSIVDVAPGDDMILLKGGIESNQDKQREGMVADRCIGSTVHELM